MLLSSSPPPPLPSSSSSSPSSSSSSQILLFLQIKNGISNVLRSSDRKRIPDLRPQTEEGTSNLLPGTHFRRNFKSFSWHRLRKELQLFSLAQAEKGTSNHFLAQTEEGTSIFFPGTDWKRNFTNLLGTDWNISACPSRLSILFPSQWVTGGPSDNSDVLQPWKLFSSVGRKVTACWHHCLKTRRRLCPPSFEGGHNPCAGMFSQ